MTCLGCFWGHTAFGPAMACYTRWRGQQVPAPVTGQETGPSFDETRPSFDETGPEIEGSSDPCLFPPSDKEPASNPVYRPCRRHRPVWRLVCPDCNPRASSDPDDIPKDWRSIRRKILMRDRRRCQHCGTCEKLSVHHITPRPLGTNDPRNLITLCDDCHNVVEQDAETRSTTRTYNAASAVERE